MRIYEVVGAYFAAKYKNFANSYQNICICQIFFVLLQRKKYAKTIVNNTIMARPIAETPILYGEDAARFMQRMHNVQKISAEEKERMRKSYEWIKSISTFAF